MFSWLEGIRDMVLAAPGNADPAAGELWDSTLDRLGVADLAEAQGRVHWQLFEADDITPERPFFVLRRAAHDWEKFTATRDLKAVGSVEVYYTELAARGAGGEELTETEVYEAFDSWTSLWIENCAERVRQSTVAIQAIRQVVQPQRTPRVRRDPTDPHSDYVWAMWEFAIGLRE